MIIFIKGFIIGIGKIIPGVSGAMLAITLGVYEQALETIAKPNKSNIIFLIKLGIGITTSIIIFSGIVSFMLTKAYLPTMFLFIGLILGGLYDTRKKIKKIKKIEYTYMLLIILCTIIIYLINGISSVIMEYNFANYILLIMAGIIDAFATIVPGISGTALLMIYGYYGIIISAFGSVWNLSKLNINFFILTAYGIGLIVGIYFFSLLINYLIKTKRREMNITIYSFGISTTIILFLSTLKLNIRLIDIINSLFLFNTGIYISKKLK